MVPVDTFLGRNRELARLDALLSTGMRLATITGTAGVGKTRLVREFARPRREVLGFCDLTAARSLDELCTIVARALRIPLSSEQDVGSAVQQIGLALDARSRPPDPTPTRR